MVNFNFLVAVVFQWFVQSQRFCGSMASLYFWWWTLLFLIEMGPSERICQYWYIFDRFSRVVCTVLPLVGCSASFFTLVVLYYERVCGFSCTLYFCTPRTVLGMGLDLCTELGSSVWLHGRRHPLRRKHNQQQKPIQRQRWSHSTHNRVNTRAIYTTIRHQHTAVCARP